MKTLVVLLSGLFLFIASLNFYRNEKSEVVVPSPVILKNTGSSEFSAIVIPLDFEEKSLSMESWMTDPVSWVSEFEDPDIPIEKWMTEPWNL